MDDAAFERLLDKRDRNSYFKGLTKAAKYAKPKVEKPQKPRKKAQATPVPRKPVRSAGTTRSTQKQVVQGPRRKPGPPDTFQSNCRECHHPMRRWYETLADFPGTVQHRGHGLCKSCARGGSHQIGRPKSRPDDCTKCERAMRGCRQVLADHPGTVPYGGRGMCRTCLKKELKR